MDQENKELDQEKSSAQVKTLEEALDAEKRCSQEYLTQLKYAKADLDNLKKRFDRQLEDAVKYANERIIIELLDVVDELEMAVTSARVLNSAEDLLQGVEMTLKKLTKALENEGVSPIESVGKPFDPSRHNAVEKIEKKGVEGCTIIEEVRKGYTLRDKVIRASMVKVVVPKSQSQKDVESNEQ